jgi:hypothetical protein
MWKNTVQTDRPHMTKWCMCTALDNQGYKHTLRICNSYGFSTEKTVMQMHHNTTFVCTLPVLSSLLLCFCPNLTNIHASTMLTA